MPGKGKLTYKIFDTCKITKSFGYPVHACSEKYVLKILYILFYY